MQTMGAQYVAWKSAESSKRDGTPHLDKRMRDRFQRPRLWPHPRLRALRELAPPRRMVAPWLGPSYPWWKLQGPWKVEHLKPRKILAFSRFRAVPQAVSAALSFDLEAEFLASGSIQYPKVTKRRLNPIRGEAGYRRLADGLRR